MTKKDVVSGIDSLLMGEETVKNTKNLEDSASVPASDNIKIAIDPSSPSSAITHRLPDKLMGKARHIATKEGIAVKDVISQSLAKLITFWEKQNYEIKDDMLVSKRSKKIII